MNELSPQEVLQAIIDGVNFPKPVSEPLVPGTKYWVTDTDYERHAALDPFLWADSSCDKMFLERGLVHLSKENAVAHAKAMIRLIGGTVDD